MATDPSGIASASVSPRSQLRSKTDEFGQRHLSVASNLKVTQMDPGEYAEAVAEPKRMEAKELKDKVSRNLSVIAQLRELKSKITGVQKAAQQLSNYLGVDNSVTNLWREKAPLSVVDTVTGQPANQLVNITATSAASVGTFTLNVTQLASADQKTSTFTCPDPTVALGFTGNLSIQGQVIAVTAGQSLNDIKNSVNQVTATTNVQMSVFTTDGTNYTLQLNSTVLGTPINIAPSDGALLTSLGLTSAVTSAATLNLQMTYNGRTISRTSSNLVSDLIPGVTIEVKAKTPNPVLASVDYDRANVLRGFGGFVDSYNSLQKFAKDQTKHNPDHSPAEDAFLHRSNALRTALSTSAQILTAAVNSDAALALNNLGAIGLYVGKGGVDPTMMTPSLFSKDISIDTAVLDQLLNTNGATGFQGVLGVVGNQVTSSNGYFKVYGIPNFQNASSLQGENAGSNVTVSLQNVNGTITATFSDGTHTSTGTLSGDNLVAGTGGGVILGPIGTVFEGFAIGVAGPAVTGLTLNGPAITTTVNGTQGLLSALGQNLSNFMTPQTGAIDLEIAQLEQQNQRSNDAAERLEAQARREYTRVITEFSRFREVEDQYKAAMDQMDDLMKLMTARH